MDPVTYDKLVRIACGATIYIVVGLLMWLECKLRNDVSLKRDGYKAYKEPGFFRIIFFWLPAFFLGWFPRKWGLNNWLYK